MQFKLMWFKGQLCNLKKSFRNYQMAFKSDRNQAETGMKSILGRREQQWMSFHLYGFYPERRLQLVTGGAGQT